MYTSLTMALTQDLPHPSIAPIRIPQTQSAAQETSATPVTPAKLNMDSGKLSTSADDPDPWGSPPNTFRSSPAKNPRSSQTLTNGSAPQRTTSAYSTSVPNDSSNTPTKPSQSSGSDGNGEPWGEGNFGPPSSEGFGGNDLPGDGGFGGGAGAEGNGSAPPGRGGRAIPRRQISHGTQELLSVTALPEKEGTFLFQYRNYEISSNRRSTKVIRRYSDFVWLLDCLHKRYPFRQLPLLPPKRVASTLSFLSNDSKR